ncbi:MAG TPA: plasmid segregation centromere-binding protein ParR [Lachnoclostridium phocaeense]|uniref:Plasmid segregation centromere-binding protein ParR n=1 Tax=Lachnoclostridium phocaeense TaxID=1871021 RepID=A0A921I1W5_9FIRM|nr:plasmid segregation centromere-binding protein ParR [Lachnoclostridium phocaeense]
MKRPVFSFRPNLKDPNHRKAWEILSSVPKREKTAYLVGAILASEQASDLEEMIRRAVREEIMNRGTMADESQMEEQKMGEIPEEMFAFLEILQEE